MNRRIIPESAWARRHWKIVVAAAGAISLALVASRFFFASPAPQYTTAVVTRGDVENTVVATGILQAVRQVDVGTRVTGQLKALNVTLGDHVKAGDLVAEIDPAVPENELRAARAQLANLEAQRRAQTAKARRSKLELERQRGMLKGATTSRRDLESAEAQAFEDDAGVDALDAQIVQARSQVEIASANLNYTKITAPIEGEVVGVLVQEGQTVVAAQFAPVILKLARLDAMTVRTQIAEADVSRVKVGQGVFFAVMGDPDTRYSGTLRTVELAPQNYSEPAMAQSASQSSTSTSSNGAAAVFYNALFDVANESRQLRIGMTAQVTISLGVARGALTAPAAILRDLSADGRYSVRVLGAGGRVEVRPVRVGIDNHVLVEVLEGLKEGDRVIVGEPSATSGGDASGSHP